MTAVVGSNAWENLYSCRNQGPVGVSLLARSRFNCLTVLLVAALMGCSASDLSGASEEDIGAAFGAEDAAGGGGTDVPAPTFHLTVNTGFSDDSPIAGEPTTVHCVVTGVPEDGVEPVTSWSLVQQPVTLTHEPVINGSEVTFRTAGLYHAVCQIDSTGFIDPTPAPISVKAGDAVVVETAVEPETALKCLRAPHAATAKAEHSQPLSSMPRGSGRAPPTSQPAQRHHLRG